MILYFTGTGNSRYAAEVIANSLGDDIISMNERIKMGELNAVASEKPFVFVVPTYAWRMPRVVTDWMQKVIFKGSKKAYFVLTCGDSTGNAGTYIECLCNKLGLTYMGYRRIVMPENYIAMFPVPDEKKARAIVRKARPEILKAAADIREGRPLGEKTSLVGGLMSGIVNDIFYAHFIKDKKFYITDACSSCGSCAKLCPVNNIVMTEKGPEWNGSCTHCMACICSCPKEAIEYGRVSLGKSRYHCPVSDER